MHLENIPFEWAYAWTSERFSMFARKAINTVKIIDLVSHTTYVVFVSFIHKWWDQQFKIDSDRQIF